MSAVIGTLRAELSAGIAQFTSDMGKAANAVSGFQRSFTRVAGALTAGFGASQVISFGKSVLASAGALGEQAQKLGVSVEAVQAYRLAFQQQGATAAAADQILARLNRTLGEAATGSKTAAAAFERAGLSWEALSKAKPDERLAMLSRALLSIADPAKRAAAEVAIFGRSGQEIEAVLTSLSPGLETLKKKFDGLIVSQEVSDKADAAADRMHVAWVRTTTALTPLIANLAEAFSNLVTNMAGIEPSLKQMERGLAVAEKMAKTYAGTGAGRKAEARAEELRAQITRAKAQAAGIPFARPGQHKGGTAGAGGAAVSGGGFGPVPDSVEITPSVDGFYSDELAAIRQFTEDRRALIDAADDAAAQAKQASLDEEKAALADFHAEANARWDDYYQRQAEAEEMFSENRLAIAADMFSGLTRLAYSKNKELAALGKAAAIVQATIDGYLAVQKALATIPPPFNFAAAALIGAAAAANVAAIAGMEKGGRVTAGTPYIVGESRPEMFVPDTSGRILPEVPDGGGGQVVHIHQTLNVMPDVSQAARAQVIRMMPEIAAGTIGALQQARRRGIVA